MNEKQFEIVKSWGVLKAEKFGEEWTVDDEQTYQHLYAEVIGEAPYINIQTKTIIL